MASETSKKMAAMKGAKVLYEVGCLSSERDIGVVADTIERAVTKAVSVERDRCAKICEAEKAEYEKNSKRCSSTGNEIGYASDIHGAMACGHLAKLIREVPNV